MSRIIVLAVMVAVAYCLVHPLVVQLQNIAGKIGN